MSPVILAPTGRTLAQRTVVPMTARQVSWFIDPEAFLRHLSDLHTVKVAAYCTHCYAQGLPEDVTAQFNPSTRIWTVHCACAAYPDVQDRGDGGLVLLLVTPSTGSVDRVRVTSVDELLLRFGWSLKCGADCARLGMHDGVEGKNDPAGSTLTIQCGCTERRYHEPKTGHA